MFRWSFGPPTGLKASLPCFRNEALEQELEAPCAQDAARTQLKMLVLQCRTLIKKFLVLIPQYTRIPVQSPVTDCTKHSDVTRRQPKII